MKDKPLIYISEEAINLKRDNDNLKSIIKEVREYIISIIMLIICSLFLLGFLVFASWCLSQCLFGWCR